MKLLIISSHYLKNNAGGEGERAVQLMNYLKKNNINSSILTYQFNNNFFNSLSIKATKVSYFNERFKFPIINYQKLKQIFTLINEADTIHFMGHWSFLNAIAFPIIIWKVKSYSICAAGSLKITGRSQFLKKIFNFFIGKHIIRNANKCIAIVDNENDIYCEYGAKIENIITVPNGIDISNNVIENNIKKVDNLNLSNPYVLFVGRLNDIKGPDLLLEAFILIVKKYPNYILVFVGEDQGLKKSMSNRINECKLQDKVLFLGFRSGSEKSALYSNASLVVIPSRSEAMSIVFLEAAIHKTPVIITDNCGLNHIKNLGITNISRASSSEIAKSITLVLEDKNWRKKVSKKLYDYVINNYNWDIIIRKYITVFEETIINVKYNNNLIISCFRNAVYFVKTKKLMKLNKNPTATHAPVLIGLAENFIINKVLELGSGNISTSIFLNSSIYKNLVNLTTYENNKVWYNYIKKKHKKNSKWNFVYSNLEIFAALKKADEINKSYDLVFVDDSNTSNLRSLTIKHTVNIKNTFFIVHDYENNAYKEELKDFKNIFIVDSLTPQTAILYNGNEKIKIEKLLDTIKYYSKKIEVDDYKNWKKVFSN